MKYYYLFNSLTGEVCTDNDGLVKFATYEDIELFKYLIDSSNVWKIEVGIDH